MLKWWGELFHNLTSELIYGELIMIKWQNGPPLRRSACKS